MIISDFLNEIIRVLPKQNIVGGRVIKSLLITSPSSNFSIVLPSENFNLSKITFDSFLLKISFVKNSLSIKMTILPVI